MASEHVISLFIDFFKSNPSLVISNVVFLLLVPIEEVVFPHFYGKIMEAMNVNASLFAPFLQLIVMMIIIQICYTVSEFHDAKMLPYLQSYISERLVARVIDKYQQQYNDLELGDINTKLAKLPGVIISWFERIKNYIIPYLLVFIFGIGYFLYNDVMLGIGLTFVILIFCMFMIASPWSCLYISSTRDKCFNQIHENIDDILRNLYSVFGANQESKELQSLHSYLEKYNKLYKETIECVTKLKFWITPLIIAYLIFFAFRCYTLVSNHKISSATFVPLFIILLYILSAMKVTNDQMRDITMEWGMIVGSSDILEKERVKQPVVSLKDKYALPDKGIGFVNVSFKYPDSTKWIVKDLNVHIAPGERVCIVGDIGSGKSTLIKLLMKFHINDEGFIYYNGQRYQDINVSLLRKKIGYVPQQPLLFNRSVIDNILYGNTSYTRKDVLDYLETLGIRQEFERLDKGFDTIIGKNGTKISGGQRQLIWCLRVLLKNPDTIILDEPTSSIDEKTKHILHKMLNDLVKDKTMIMISHDPYLVNVSTRIIEMRNGGIIKDSFHHPQH